MPPYLWDYVQASSAHCPIASQTEFMPQNHCTLSKAAYQCPRAPKQKTIPLKTSKALVPPNAHVPPDLFPIRLVDISSSQEAEMVDVVLTFPIHIHTPTMHLGSIRRGITGGHTASARDIILKIRTFTQQSLDYYAYMQLSEETKIRLKAAYMQRCGTTSTAATTWAMFASGEFTNYGPVGADLLLGCTEVWGLEGLSFGGYSIVHLA